MSDQLINPLAVPCRICGVDAGQPCRRIDSPQDLARVIPLETPHPERLVDAFVAAGGDAPAPAEAKLDAAFDKAAEGRL